MSEGHGRRSDDSGWSRIIKLWPLIAAAFMAVGAYFIKAEKLDVTAELAGRTAGKVEIVEREQAVQRQMLADIRDAQGETRRDLKEILRRVR